MTTTQETTQQAKPGRPKLPKERLPRALTTGVISRMLRVSARKVANWCDSGLLKSYRLPGGLDRRVEPSDLVKFLQEHRMPTPVELQSLVPASRLLLVGPTSPMLDAFEGALRISEDAFGGRPVDIAEDAFEAGLLLRGVHDLVIIDGNIGLGVSGQIAEEAGKVPGARVVVVAPEDAGRPVIPGCQVIRHPVAISDLLRVMEEVASE